jgi:hypothetical protein
LQNWNARPYPQTPEDVRNRWVAYGGGLGPAQLQWLRHELAAAQRGGERALVMTHCPLHPDTVGGRASTLLWNYPEVLQAMWDVPGVVAATFAGDVRLCDMRMACRTMLWPCWLQSMAHRDRAQVLWVQRQAPMHAAALIAHRGGAGHVHRQDYHVDHHGIQHFALPALLEAPKDADGCHGIVTVTEEALHMQGFGDMASHGAQLPTMQS